MLKKIRRFYWHRRDRGLGRQTIMVAMALVLFLILMVGLIARNIVNRGDLESGGQNQAVTGSVVETEVATGAAIEETASVEQEESTQKQEVIYEKGLVLVMLSLLLVLGQLITVVCPGFFVLILL